MEEWRGGLGNTNTLFCFTAVPNQRYRLRRDHEQKHTVLFALRYHTYVYMRIYEDLYETPTTILRQNHGWLVITMVGFGLVLVWYDDRVAVKGLRISILTWNTCCSHRKTNPERFAHTTKPPLQIEPIPADCCVIHAARELLILSSAPRTIQDTARFIRPQMHILSAQRSASCTAANTS